MHTGGTGTNVEQSRVFKRGFVAVVCYESLILTCRRITQDPAYNEFGFDEHPVTTNRSIRITLTTMFKS